jgi:ABC-type Fe3+/spermidine/putrescine transport system ATPase subunit
MTSSNSGSAKSSAKAEAGAALRLEAVRFAFGRAPPAVDGVSLDVAAGSFFALLGPSGCGKTTLLRLVGGYLRPQEGTIHLGARDVTSLPPERRGVGMVFQNYALFPHLSARGNVAFGLEVRGVPRRERQRQVEDILDRVGLEGTERERRPHELSGGQQQRVALARALVLRPQVLLLDEPFANLDRRLREQMRGELRDLQGRTGVTTLLVTHDQEEALALAGRVGLMRGGRLVQAGTPQELYRRPCDRWAACFLGDANLWPVEGVDGDEIHLQGGLSLDGRRAGLESMPAVGSVLMVRPEHGVAGLVARSCPCTWEGEVTASTFLGHDQVVSVALTPKTTIRVRCRPADGEAIVGSRVLVGIPAGALWPLPGDSP